MRLGIFSLQGAVEPHQEKFNSLGAETLRIREAEELDACDGLVLPGGESTTFLKLVEQYGLKEPLIQFGEKKPIWGICAGAILLAEQVENPTQGSLGLVPVTIRRNAYGRQNESFITEVGLSLNGSGESPTEAVFIRAPQITQWDDRLDVLASHQSQPVVARFGHHLLTTFHPELSPTTTLHQYFLSLCEK